MNDDSWYFPNLWRNKKGHYKLSTCLWAEVYRRIVYFQSVLIFKKWHLIWDLAKPTKPLSCSNSFNTHFGRSMVF